MELAVSVSWSFDFVQLGLGIQPDGFDIVSFYDFFQCMQIVITEESDSGSFSSHPRGSAGPMGVCLRVERKIVIYNIRDMAEIQASAGNVGCDDCFDLLLFELTKNRRPPGLLYAPV